MIYELFVVQDVKANAADVSLGLIPGQNEDMVKRGLKSLILQGQLPKQMMQFPEDFYLYRVGAFETSELDLVAKKDRICCIADLFPSQEEKAA